MTKSKWINRIVGHDEVAPDQLLANPLNYRIHPAQQQSALSGSLDNLGWIQEVLVNKNTGHVIDGHLRIQLALRNNEKLIPVTYLNLNEDEERLALLSLDPIAAMAATDKEQLETLLNQVNSDDKRVQEFLSNFAKDSGLTYGEQEYLDAEPQIDRAEELQKKWKVKMGDLYSIGEHKLLCGDSTKRDDVERVMMGDKITLSITSPPYYNQRDYSQWKTFDDYMVFTEKIINNIIEIANKEFALVWNIGDQCANGANEETKDIPAYHSVLFETLGLKYRDKIIWRKNGAVFDIPRSQHIDNGRYFPALGYEIILVYTFKHPSFDINDKSKVKEWQINVWEMKQVRSNSITGHPAEYPEELPSRAITCYTTKNQFVYEPFCGSGTTMVACQNLSRKCRAIEISEKYCAVILDRMEQAFGITGERID